MSFSPSPSPSPSLSPSPLPAAPPLAPGQDGESIGFGEGFGDDGGLETALQDAENESVVTESLTGSEAMLSGFADSLSAQQASSSNAFTNGSGTVGPLSAYAGQNVDPYTNAVTAAGDIYPYSGGYVGSGSTDLFAHTVAELNPVSTAANASAVDTSQMLAQNSPVASFNPAGEIGNSVNPSLSELSIPGSQSTPQSFSTGWFTATPIDTSPSSNAAAQGTQLVDGPDLLPSASPAVNDLNSMSWEDFAAKYDLADASPVPAAPSLSLQSGFPDLATGVADLFGPSALAPPAQPAFAQAPSPESGWDTFIGDWLATLVGLFAPLLVGQSVHPAVPLGLPPGLQAMGQMNAQMAQQSLQMNSAAARGAILGAGAPYAASELALTGPAAGDAAFKASIRVASQFPTSTSVVTGLGNALSGNLIPRAAVGVGAAATLQLAAGEAESAGQQAAIELPALGQRLGASLPTSGPALAQSPSAQVLARNFSRGIGFQNAVTSFLGSNVNVRNTTAMLGQTSSGGLRIVVPDIYAGGQAPIGDVKDVLRLNFTGQLQAMFDVANATGTSFNIIASPRTISVSRPLVDAVQSSGGFIFRFDTSTNLSEVWDTASNAWVRFF